MPQEWEECDDRNIDHHHLLGGDELRADDAFAGKGADGGEHLHDYEEGYGVVEGHAELLKAGSVC